MAYYLLEDFRGGIDLRRTSVSTKPGALRDIQNGFVTVGGEIEQRRKLALQHVLPANCAGIVGVGGEIWVHGLLPSSDPSLAGLGPLYRYQQLIPNPAVPAGTKITRIIDADLFNRYLYLIVKLTDGTIRYFYNNVEIVSADLDPGGWYTRRAETHKDKVYTTHGNILQFSAVGIPNDLAGTGSGFIDVTSRDFGSADMIGLETYFNDLAIFGLRSVQIWQMDPDPTKNQIVQVIGGLGLIGGNAHVRYGNGDILFLTDTGIRSLKARDSSGAATQGDIGTPIDELVREMRRRLVPGDLDNIQALVEPSTGCIWFVWKNTVLCLGYYPVSDVTAWSRFDLGFTADYATVAGNRVFFRSGNNLYIYGSVAPELAPIDPTTSGLGDSAEEYDGSVMQVVTPMFDFGKPGHFKTYTGLDLTCDGVIHVDVNYDPQNTSSTATWNPVVTVKDNTFGLGRVPLEGYSTHIGLRFRSEQGFARIGAVAIHYEQADAE